MRRLLIAPLIALAVAGCGTTVAPPRAVQPPTLTPRVSPGHYRTLANPTVGETFTANPGEWSNATSFTYQWEGCIYYSAACQMIPGATGVEHTVTEADRGRFLRANVTALGTGLVKMMTPPTGKVPWGVLIDDEKRDSGKCTVKRSGKHLSTSQHQREFDLETCEAFWISWHEGEVKSTSVSMYGPWDCELLFLSECEENNWPDEYFDKEEGQGMLSVYATCPCDHVSLAGVSTVEAFENVVHRIEKDQAIEKTVIIQAASGTTKDKRFALSLLLLIQRGGDKFKEWKNLSYVEGLSEEDVRKIKGITNPGEGTAQGIRKYGGIWSRCGYTVLACVILSPPGGPTRTIQLPEEQECFSLCEPYPHPPGKVQNNLVSRVTIKGGDSVVLRCSNPGGGADCGRPGFFGIPLMNVPNKWPLG